MKKKLSRMWRSGMAFVLAACMAVGLCPSVAFAQEKTSSESKEIKYVSIGDSMANGYCFDGYKQGDLEGEAFYSGDGVYGTDAYPLQFEEWLRGEGYDVEHTKIAVSAMRAEDLNHLLGGREMPKDGWFSQVNGYTDIYDTEGLSAYFTQAVTDADIITLGIGNASFGAYMLHRVTDALGVFGASLDEDEKVNLEMALTGLEPEQKAVVVKIYNEMKSEMEKYVPAELMALFNVNDVCDLIAYTAVGFIMNYKGALERIVELNPDCEIILVGLMNTTYGMTITMDGMNPIPIGDIMGGVFGALNTYIAGLPTVMQTAGEWKDAKFYYVEETAPLFISQQFAALKEAGWDTVDRLSGEIVRDRNIDAYNGSLRKMVGGAFGVVLQEINLADVEAYEANTPDWTNKDYNYGFTGTDDDLKNLSIAIYLGIEDAVAESTDTMEIPLSGLIKIAGDLSSVFTGLNVNPADPESTPESIHTGLADYLTSTPELQGMCKIYALFKVGNGMSVHPTPAGHDKIAVKVIAAYENNHTAKDEVIERVEIALDELYKLIEEYGPEVLDEAYKYAQEQGYVEAVNTAVAELKAELESKTTEYINTTKPAVEAAIKELQDESAALYEKLTALKAELEAKKAELETAAGEVAENIEATIAQIEEAIAVLEATIAAVEAQIADIEATINNLKNGLSAIEGELAALASAVVELNDSAVAVMDVLKNVDGTVEAVIAAVDAARDAVEAAAALVGAAYERVETLVNETVELVTLAGEKVADLAEMVKTDVQAAYDALPEEVKAQLAAAAAEIMKAAEEAKAIIEAELAEKIAALQAELQPVIDAKIAELEALQAQIEAEIEAKAAELKAAAEAQIAELEAAAQAQIAELEAALEAKNAELKAAVEAQKAELEAALAEKQAELEALLKELENAAEDVKAQIEAQIAEVEAAIAEVEAQIAQTITDLENQIAALNAELEAAVTAINEDLKAAVDAVNAELEAAIAEIRAELEAAYAEAVAALEAAISDLETELNEKIAELTEAAQQQIAGLMDAAEKKAAELLAAGEEFGEVLEAIVAEANAATEALKAEVEAIVGETIDNVDELVAAAQVMAGELADTIDAKIDEVMAAIEEAYINATTCDYVPGEDSFYVAIGDASAVSRSYVDILAEELDVDYANLAQKGLMIEDAYAVLSSNTDTIAKADLITVGFTSNEFINETVDQIYGQIFGGTVDLDWAAYVGAENVPYVEQLLAEVNASIAENVEDAATAALLSTAVEVYAYSYVAYVCELPELINEIRAINPEATIIIVGMYNPLEDMIVQVDENTTVNIGEYLDYLTDAVGIYTTAYAMLTSNGIYIAAPDVQTGYEADANTTTLIALGDLLAEYIGNSSGESMLPSELGHEYIAAQIANGLGKDVEVPEEPEKGLLGDANRDGIVDSFDATLIQRYDVGRITETGLDLSVCDVSGDGIVDSFDATLIQRYDVGRITSFPAAG